MPPLSSPALVLIISGKLYSTRLCSFAEMLLLFDEVTDDHSLKSLLGKYHAADMQFPRKLRPGGHFILGKSVRGDTISWGTLFPLTPGPQRH